MEQLVASPHWDEGGGGTQKIFSLVFATSAAGSEREEDGGIKERERGCSGEWGERYALPQLRSQVLG